MAYCIPIKDMKNTSSFTKMVKEANHPIFVTKNGREEFVVMSTEVFQEKNSDLLRQSFYNMIDKSLEDVRAGRVMEAKEFIDSTRKKYADSN